LKFVIYRYSTKLGMYEENCGLDKVTMSWGHDEYMYRMLQHNKSTLPEEAFYIIRQGNEHNFNHLYRK
jgi:inositol oxygenase